MIDTYTTNQQCLQAVDDGKFQFPITVTPAIVLGGIASVTCDNREQLLECLSHRINPTDDRPVHLRSSVMV